MVAERRLEGGLSAFTGRAADAPGSAGEAEAVEALVVPPSRRRPSYRWLSVPARRKGLPVVTRRFVEAAHATGVGVLVWTIDEPREIER